MGNHELKTASAPGGGLTCLAILVLWFTPAQATPSACGGAGTMHQSPWLTAAEKYRLDALDLYAIALWESRVIWSDGLLRPWPWTLHTAVEGALYFPSYEAAREKLEQLIARGETNIDIGMMQINWRANGWRLPTPAKLLLPQNNLDVAAQILRAALDSHAQDRRLAVARYHSSRDELGLPYQEAVFKIRERFEGFADLINALADCGSQ
jgi:hypothetical protein